MGDTGRAEATPDEATDEATDAPTPATAPDQAAACTDDEADLARRLRFCVGRLGRQLRGENLSLTPSQVSVLFSAQKFGPSRMVDLAAKEALAPPTLTTIVASLVNLGLLDRVANPDDGRSSLVEVTARGEDLLAAMLAERTRLLFRKIERMSPEGRAKLAAAVEFLEEMLEEPSDLSGPRPAGDGR